MVYGWINWKASASFKMKSSFVPSYNHVYALLNLLEEKIKRFSVLTTDQLFHSELLKTFLFFISFSRTHRSYPASERPRSQISQSFWSRRYCQSVKGQGSLEKVNMYVSVTDWQWKNTRVLKDTVILFCFALFLPHIPSPQRQGEGGTPANTDQDHT